MTMNADRWRRLEELFAAAAALDSGARERFLDVECGGDPGLRRDVESLLAAGEEAGDFIVAAVDDAASSLATEDDDRSGERIGPYRLVRELGRGGMGAVYLAERADDEFQGQVAIKLVLGDRHSPQLLRRFRAERQILARLDHPNIARLLDAGSTADGTPYVIMEYVDGERIDAHCARYSLSTAQRLALFRTVCDAVQYAHRHLIVHRDLKPSNILVARDGAVKLLDFGIAKLLERGETDAEDATQTGVRLLTPTYASPEQVRGEPITTASDVYSLGVVLYEMLTGALPYRLPSGSAHDLERVITQEEPARPSVSAPPRLRRELRGDLDTIVLMALRKEPERRYASAGELAEDVRRHLDGIPVRARPDTVGYRTGKFVRRHRAGVGASITGVMVVVALIAFYTARLAGERDRARLAADEAEQVAEFLQSVFEVSSPGRSRGQTVTARELLDSSAVRVQNELAEQPEVRAAMMGVMGNVYNNLGLYDEAAPLLEEALRVRRELHGPSHEDVAQSSASLAANLADAGEHQRADSLLREALRVRRALYRGDHPRVLASLEQLGHFLARRGDLPAADTLYREAFAMHGRLAPDTGRLASLLDGHAYVLDALGDLAGSEALHRESVALVENRMRGDSLILGIALNNLALVLTSRGNYAEAEPMIRRSLAIARAYYGDQHPHTAAGMVNLGRLLLNRSRLAEAESLFLASVEIERRLLGEEHPSLATNLAFVGEVMMARGDFVRAEPYYRRALELRRNGLGAEHPWVAISLNELGANLHAQGRLEDAEPMYRQGLELRRRVHPPTHPYVAYSLVGLGKLLIERGEASTAEPLVREALEIRRASLPAEHFRVAEVRSLLGSALTEQGRYEEAEPELVAAHEVLRASRPERDRLRTESFGRVVRLYELTRRAERVAAVLP